MDTTCVFVYAYTQRPMYVLLAHQSAVILHHFIYMHAHTHTHTHTHTHCACTHTHATPLKHTQTWMHPHNIHTTWRRIRNGSTQRSGLPTLYVCINTSVCTHKHTHTHTHTHTNSRKHTHECIHIHTYSLKTHWSGLAQCSGRATQPCLAKCSQESARHSPRWDC
jgi:hypothetical protein